MCSLNFLLDEDIPKKNFKSISFLIGQIQFIKACFSILIFKNLIFFITSLSQKALEIHSAISGSPSLKITVESVKEEPASL